MRYSEITNLSTMVILVNVYRLLIEYPSESWLKVEKVWVFWSCVLYQNEITCCYVNTVFVCFFQNKSSGHF